MQKSLTVQELEKLDVAEYKSNPDELITFARQLLNIKKYEKAIEMLEKAIIYSIANSGNNETHINCAKFYCEYADALIRKIMDNEELFANPLEGDQKNTAEQDKNGVEAHNQNTKQENKDNNVVPVNNSTI